MSRRSLAILSIVLLMIVWGSTFIVTKSVIEEIPPLALAALRFMIASAVLVPLAVWRGGLARLPRPLPIGALVAMGITGFVIYYVGFNYALVYASASQGALLQALGPTAIAIAAVLFLKETPTKRRVLGILLSVCGVALVVAAGKKDGAAPNPVLGAAFMLGAIVAWAVYTIFAKRLARADQVVVTACVAMIGTAMLIPLAALELHFEPWPSLSPRGWLSVLYLGVVASAAGFFIYNRALRELDASLVGAYVNLVPIAGVLAAVLFLGERLDPLQILGALIALTGMWMAS